MSQDVLTDDDAHIDNGADGEGNSGQGDDVGVDAEQLHRDEGCQHRQRQHTADNDRAAQVHHQHQHDDNRDQYFLGQGRFQRAEGFVDQAGAVVKRDDCDLGGCAVVQLLGRQAGRDFFDIGFHVFDRLQRIIAVTDDRDSAAGFGAGFIQRSATQGRPQRDMRDVLDPDRYVVTNGDDGLFNVADVFQKAQAPDDILGSVDLDGTGTDIDVGGLDGHEDLFQRDVEGPHRVRVHVDLVFFCESADGGDLADAFGAHESVAYIPVLDSSQLFRVPAAGGMAVFVAAFQRVPEDLPQRGCIRSE